MAQEEEVLGKAYDSRLMKRLLTYLRPYKLQVGFALSTIVLKAAADVIGPVLTILAVDKYLAPKPAVHYLLGHWLTAERVFGRWLSPRPLVGIAQIASIYVGLITFSFLLEYLQTYFMQWAGQMVMFDLRSEIFSPRTRSSWWPSRIRNASAKQWTSCARASHSSWNAS